MPLFGVGVGSLFDVANTCTFGVGSLFDAKTGQRLSKNVSAPPKKSARNTIRTLPLYINT